MSLTLATQPSCGGDVHVMGAIVRQSRTKIETADTVPGPGSAYFGGFVDEDGDAGQMRAEVEWGTLEAVIRGDNAQHV